MPLSHPAKIFFKFISVHYTIMLAIGNREWGKPVDKEALTAAQAGLKSITPSSPLRC